MKTVAIVAKTGSPLAKDGVRSVSEWLHKKGVTTLFEEGTARLVGTDASPKETIVGNADMVVVMGGDGTFLSAARMMQTVTAPIMGINLGSLGFLTEFTLEESLLALEKIVAGDFHYEERIMIDVKIVRGEETIATHTALNDIVINRKALARMVKVEATIDGAFVNEYTADGLIVATPTGSTAYNLAANGPIVHPSLTALIISPVCPHTLSNRPVVIPDKVALELRLAPGRIDKAVISIDGQVGYEISPKDRIIIRRSKQVTRVILSPNKNYYQILREKLKWGETIRHESR